MCKNFKIGRTKVHDQSTWGRKSIATEKAVERINQIIKWFVKGVATQISHIAIDHKLVALNIIHSSKNFGITALCPSEN